jgi:hypothetical protein
MRTIATSSVILLCTFVVLPLWGSSSAPQIGLEAPDARAFGEEQVEGDTATPAPRVRVEAVLVQVGKDAVEDLEKAAGMRLGAEADQLVLKPGHLGKLLDAVRENPAARIVASSSTLIASGKKGLIQLQGELFRRTEPEAEAGEVSSASGIMTEPGEQFILHARGGWSELLPAPKLTTIEEDGRIEVVQEISYPTEYDLQTMNVKSGEAGGVAISPEEAPATDAEVRRKKKVIAAIKLTPTVMRRARIALVATVEISVLTSPSDAEAVQDSGPLFRTWTKTTSLIIPDGSSFALKEAPIIPFSPARAEEKPSPQRRDILKKLDTVIPEVHFEDADLVEVIGYLSRQCEVNIIIDPSIRAAPEGRETPNPLPETPGTGTPSEKPQADMSVNVKLTNIPLKELLKYILSYKNLKYMVEDYAVVVAPVDWTAPEAFQTEIVRLAIGAEGVVERPDTGSDKGSGTAAGEAIEAFLRESGIPWPEGSGLNYNTDTGTLIVTNTPENLALIRESLSLWGDPQSRGILLTIISAKVVEPE